MYNMQYCSVYIQYTVYVVVYKILYCAGLHTLTVGVGRLTAKWNAEVYYTVIHIVIALCVCMYSSCLWSMMFIQHCSFILCSFAAHGTQTVCVCITASLGHPFNFNVVEGDITSFLPNGEGATIWPCTVAYLC